MGIWGSPKLGALGGPPLTPLPCSVPSSPTAGPEGPPRPPPSGWPKSAETPPEPPRTATPPEDTPRPPGGSATPYEPPQLPALPSLAPTGVPPATPPGEGTLGGGEERPPQNGPPGTGESRWKGGGTPETAPEGRGILEGGSAQVMAGGAGGVQNWGTPWLGVAGVGPQHTGVTLSPPRPPGCAPLPWGGWGSCSRSCGVGVALRRREGTPPERGCAHPPSIDTRVCFLRACPGTPNPRDPRTGCGGHPQQEGETPVMVGTFSTGGTPDTGWDPQGSGLSVGWDRSPFPG